MYLKAPLLAIAVTLFSASYSQAQQFNNTALAAKAAQFTEEVEGPCTQYKTADHIAINANLLSRVEVKIQVPTANDSYQLLSSTILKNKCVPNLTRDEATFDPSTFNPLKYFLNFTAGQITTYRVDNSNYIITIHP